MTYPVRDALPYAVNAGWQRLRQSADTVCGRLLLRWWNIQGGKNSRFFGLPLVSRHPTARVSIGEGCIFRSAEWSNSIGINRRCFLAAERDAEIEIGDTCGFSGTIIAASSSIRIGARVLCGGNCTIVDTDRHPITAAERAAGGDTPPAPIVIENDVFLGMNVMVLKGCTVGQGTVVAAGSIVTRSLPQGVLAGGIPARPLRELDEG